MNIKATVSLNNIIFSKTISDAKFPQYHSDSQILDTKAGESIDDSKMMV